MTKKKKILLVIGGGISAYKSLDLIRIMQKNDYEVRTILTKSGKKFVTPLSITALTKSKPFVNLFDIKNESEIDHIKLSRWADLIVVVPATANFISKLSQGRAEDLATTVILASNKEILLVPAMNVRMWLHKATQKNVDSLKDYGYEFVGPKSGKMACGEYGSGKMSSPKEIYQSIKNFFQERNKLKSKKISAIVTSGPTREYIDPVRYISNESSGKQGYEIAISLARRGIKTTLITGPSKYNKSKIMKIVKVSTAKEMLEQVKKKLPVDIAVCAAAVSDFRPKEIAKTKIKKNFTKKNYIHLEKNPDILEYLGKSNRTRPRVLAGFSAETDDIIKNSKEKLFRKHCDLIIANDVSKKNIGFNSDFNEVSIISKSGIIETISRSKKSFIAKVLTNKLLEKFIKTN